MQLSLTYLLLPTLALETRRRGTPTLEFIDQLAAAHRDIRELKEDLAKQQLPRDEVEVSNALIGERPSLLDTWVDSGALSGEILLRGVSTP